MEQLFGNQFGASPLTQMGLGNNTGSTGLSSLLSGCVRGRQNEERLMAEKSQRNILRKYLTQATGDPIQSAFISDNIQGKGYGDTLDLGLGTKSSIMQSLGLAPQASQTPNLLGTLSGLGGQPTNSGLLGTLGGLGGNNTSSILGTLGTLGSLANLGKTQNANPSLLNSLVSLASTPNNNGNILNTLGGMGGGLFGSNTANTGGVLGNIKSGINTLNTINKVNNAVSGVKGLFA